MTAFPYRRLAYHTDGTQVFLIGPQGYSVWDELAQDDYPALRYEPRDVEPTALAGMNSIVGSTAALSYTRTGLLILFPTPMCIRGILPFFRQGGWTPNPGSGNPNIARARRVTVEYSQDAAELADGTYTSIGLIPQTLPHLFSEFVAPRHRPGFVADTYQRTLFPTDDQNVANRDDATALDLRGLWKEIFVTGAGGVAPMELRQVTALRLIFTDEPPPSGYYLDPQNAPFRTVYANLYLYGDPERGAWRDYMQVQDMTNHDTTLASQMDWGDAPWDSSADRGIRIQNHSPVAEARDIDVFFDIGPQLMVTDELSNMFVFSLDNGQSWQEKVTLAGLSPGATSPVVLIRRVTTEADPLGRAQPLLRTRVGEWIHA